MDVYETPNLCVGVEQLARSLGKRVISLRFFEKREAGLAALNAVNLLFQGYDIIDCGGGTDEYVIVGLQALINREEP